MQPAADGRPTEWRPTDCDRPSDRFVPSFVGSRSSLRLPLSSHQHFESREITFLSSVHLTPLPQNVNPSLLPSSGAKLQGGCGGGDGQSKATLLNKMSLGRRADRPPPRRQSATGRLVSQSESPQESGHGAAWRTSTTHQVISKGKGRRGGR